MMELEQVKTYVIENADLRVEIMNLGATVTSLQFQGREVVLHYENPSDYLTHDGYLNAIVGRYANRIGRATATIHDQVYQMVPNDGKNQLHGGPNSFDRKLWTATLVEKDQVRFELFSPDGENGYPGNLTAGVTYRISNNQLQIDFDGVSDKDTLYAPTTHMYFNLGSASVLDASMQICADAYLKVDNENIPVSIEAVDSVFDFRTMRRIKENYDHCFILSGEPACILEDQGLRMTIRTDYPGLQVYTGFMLNGQLHPNQGIALEPEVYPDSPNHPEYPSAILQKNKLYKKFIEYSFKMV